MWKFLFVFFCFIVASTLGQSFQKQLLTQSFKEYQKSPGIQKKHWEFKSKKEAFNPFNYLGKGFLFVYQKVFSEQIQAACSYETSCSEYTRLAIQHFGFVQGTLMGFNQLSECTRSAKYEHPRVYLNPENKIINRFETLQK
jgi:putative component of membrane protein insertase Oxa1/YidC/SpoIIIJ protein YidD